MTGERPLEVAILGARGIGQVHARIFRELGANVRAVLGTTEESARATASAISTSLGIDVKPFFELDRLLAEPVAFDAVSICTPPRLHFDHLRAVLDRGIPAFCEKPLFWEEGASHESIGAKIDTIAAHPSRRVFVNTSNAAFVDAVRARLPAPEVAKSFSFRFYTSGPYRGRDIAVDLTPHAHSLLLRYFGLRAIRGYEATVTETRYQARFDYGGAEVTLDFQEGGEPNALGFSVDGREMRRVQEGRGATYRVFLLDVETNEKVPVDDPFATYIARFTKSVRERDTTVWATEWEEASANLRLMAEVLATGPKNTIQG